MISSVSSLLFYVKDRDTTLNFYKSLGFDTNFKDNMVQVKVNWFYMNFIDREASNFKEGFDVEPKGHGVFTYIKVENVDDYYKQILNNGIKPSTEPKDWEWGNREFVVKDPDGYRLVFFNKVKK